MAVTLAVELDALQKMRLAAKTSGVPVGTICFGLLELWEWCWRQRVGVLTRAQMLAFLPNECLTACVDFGFLAMVGDKFRVRGADKYLRIKEAQSQAGKKVGKANLKQYSKPGPELPEPKPAAAPRSTPGEGHEPPVPPPAKAPEPEDEDDDEDLRELSDWEWSFREMETARVRHCAELGIEPGESKPLKNVNAVLKKAADSIGLAEYLPSKGKPISPGIQLALLYDEWLQQPFGNTPDKEGKPRDPPWPIPLFLSAGVLQRVKAAYDASTYRTVQ